ncbi:histidine phosphatase family protein [Bacillus sp. 31A1R]|uniref:Histidine phosphatase family protein n=1 Tax=Robertmurraya mangrovi TaxID=3098077 RepID=A0ABU5IWQ8_9BACI|nr:histidine phosphatase family protein [Bacillus sp. 31A1R]MDZ5471587.1 histidine phosphatase family protein [Bacillus sp. 31A1R]
MKIGLVRHFKVKKDYPKKFVTSAEMIKWFEEYNEADIETGIVELNDIIWDECYSSDLHRAEKTAQHIYSGEINRLSELREISIFPLTNRKVKLPFFIWALLVRTAWLMDHKSQMETKAHVKMRINQFLDQILPVNKNILIVSHGALMIFMGEELKKRGFQGPKIRNPKNGQLYLYEK